MALVITRKAQQSFWIGDDVEVKLLRVQKNGVVQIAITAPKEVTILRTEVKERNQKQPA